MHSFSMQGEQKLLLILRFIKSYTYSGWSEASPEIDKRRNSLVKKYGTLDKHW